MLNKSAVLSFQSALISEPFVPGGSGFDHRCRVAEQPSSLFYSARSALTGSARDARQAGTNAATHAIVNNVDATTIIETGSLGLIP